MPVKKKRHFGYRMVLQHRMIVEFVFGKPLPATAVVHHVDGNRKNNSRGNLVVCNDRAYHSLLHMRQAALDATGNPAHRRCTNCGQHDAVENMEHHNRPPNSSYIHSSCRRAKTQKYFRRMSEMDPMRLTRLREEKRRWAADHKHIYDVRRAARHREAYANNPAYRARWIARGALYIEKNKSDPAFMARRAATRALSYEKRKVEPSFRENKRAYDKHRREYLDAPVIGGFGVARPWGG